MKNFTSFGLWMNIMLSLMLIVLSVYAVVIWTEYRVEKKVRPIYITLENPVDEVPSEEDIIRLEDTGFFADVVVCDTTECNTVVEPNTKYHFSVKPTLKSNRPTESRNSVVA